MKKYAIVAPCFNEGSVIDKFLTDLEQRLISSGCSYQVIIVDDGSTDSTSGILDSYQFQSSLFGLKVIRLKYNMGHQEAIRQGLIYAHRLDVPFDGVIVMDSDGEDDPQAIVEITKLDQFDIVLFERGKRNENLQFKIGVFFYQLIFKIITGKRISFGNYSLISSKVLKAIANQRFFHFASFLSKQRFNIDKMKFDRRPRINGKSKMNYNRLVIHGLKSLIEYSEELLGFFIRGLLAVSVVAVAIGLTVLYKKFISHEAILGWASTLGIGVVSIFLIITTFIVSSLMLLSIKNMINQSDDSYEEVRS